MPSGGFTGLGAPTQQPGTPVTDGAAAGPGAGPEALGLPDPNRGDAAFLKKYLPVLLDMAQRDDTPPATKAYIRAVIANS